MSFSKSFPLIFIKLIGLYFVVSVLASLPGFSSGIIIATFHSFGKYAFDRHRLYIPVTNNGNLLKAIMIEEGNSDEIS